MTAHVIAWAILAVATYLPFLGLACMFAHYPGRLSTDPVTLKECVRGSLVLIGTVGLITGFVCAITWAFLEVTA